MPLLCHIPHFVLPIFSYIPNSKVKGFCKPKLAFFKESIRMASLSPLSMIDQDYDTLGTLDDNAEALILEAKRIIPQNDLEALADEFRTHLVTIGIPTAIDLDSATHGSKEVAFEI